jgi:hypothetical protein
VADTSGSGKLLAQQAQRAVDGYKHGVLQLDELEDVLKTAAFLHSQPLHEVLEEPQQLPEQQQHSAQQVRDQPAAPQLNAAEALVASSHCRPPIWCPWRPSASHQPPNPPARQQRLRTAQERLLWRPQLVAAARPPLRPASHM